MSFPTGGGKTSGPLDLALCYMSSDSDFQITRISRILLTLKAFWQEAFLPELKLWFPCTPWICVVNSSTTFRISILFCLSPFHEMFIQFQALSPCLGECSRVPSCVPPCTLQLQTTSSLRGNLLCAGRWMLRDKDGTEDVFWQQDSIMIHQVIAHKKVV